MKRIPLIISLVVLFALNGNAQIGDLRFGLKLGPSFDWASSGSVETGNEGVKLGFNAGLVLDYYLTDNIRNEGDTIVQHIDLTILDSTLFLQLNYQNTRALFH